MFLYFFSLALDKQKKDQNRLSSDGPMTQDFICKFGESIPKYADLIVGYAMRPGNVMSTCSIPQKV